MFVSEVVKQMNQEEKDNKEESSGVKTSGGEGEKSEKEEGKTETVDDSEDEGNTKGCIYGAFQRCRPLTFDGEKGSSATLQWVSEMEAAIEISECKASQAVKFAAHSFTGNAIYWWDTIK